MVMKDNRQYLITHIDSCPNSLHILSFIKDAFEYLFWCMLIIFIANISLPALHPLLLVVVVKPSGRQKNWPKRNHSADDVVMNRELFSSGENNYIL